MTMIFLLLELSQNMTYFTR